MTFRVARILIVAAMAMAIATSPASKVQAQGTGSVEIANFLYDPVQMQCMHTGRIDDHRAPAVIEARGTYSWSFALGPNSHGWRCHVRVNSRPAHRSFSASVLVWPESRECIDCAWTITGDGFHRNGVLVAPWL